MGSVHPTRKSGPKQPGRHGYGAQVLLGVVTCLALAAAVALAALGFTAGAIVGVFTSIGSLVILLRR